jgi:hypothetical protein
MSSSARYSWLSAGVVFGAMMFASSVPVGPANDARSLIKRSVVVNDSDWSAQTRYSHQERDVNQKLKADGTVSSTNEKTSRVFMIDGSPYNELIAVQGEPLSPAQKRQESAKLKTEIKKRNSESPSDRAERMQNYTKERSEERLLLHEMIAAFNFSHVGEEKVNGVDCYVLDATPNPNYRPSVQKARVLTGMKGKLWIAKDTYHWVRVHASVFQPVEFGFFLAKVRPGTQFELDQSPVDKSTWMPSHFSQSVDARVLGIYGIRTKVDEYYSDYQLSKANSTLRSALDETH